MIAAINQLKGTLDKKSIKPSSLVTLNIVAGGAVTALLNNRDLISFCQPIILFVESPMLARPNQILAIDHLDV